MANRDLRKAKKQKDDEFYTQIDDINSEVQNYIDYNKDVFKDKTILLPCDDPWGSNFLKFFAIKFYDYGLKRLIATSYSKSPVLNKQLSLFKQDNKPKLNKAYKIELTRQTAKDVDGNGVYNIKDVEKILDREGKKLDEHKHSDIITYLKGDGKYLPGDFRSREVTKLRDESDAIITNPPFSLFREFVKWIEPTKRKFLIIGNNNVITYKEIFPLIKKNIIWLGVDNGDKSFRVPANYPPKKTRFWIDKYGQKWRSMGNIRELSESKFKKSWLDFSSQLFVENQLIICFNYTS